MHRSVRYQMVARQAGTLLILSLLTLPAAVLAQSPTVPSAGVIVFQRETTDGAPATSFAIDPAGTGELALRPVNFVGPSLTPDGTRVTVVQIAADGAFMGGGVMNVDGTGYAAIPAVDKTLNLGPGLWLNNVEATFQGWDDTDATRNGAYVADPTDITTLRRLTSNPNGGNDGVVAVSADGSKVAFVRTKAGTDNGELWVVDADGSNQVRVSPPGTLLSSYIDWGAAASWSPDAKQVAFAPIDGDGCQCSVSVVNADGSGLREIFRGTGLTFGAHWSPDGQWIAFESAPPGSNWDQVMLIHPDGTGLKTLTGLHDDTGSWGPTWSPDGTKLLFQHGTGGQDGIDLWTSNVDGSGLTQLTHVPNRYGPYSWGP